MKCFIGFELVDTCLERMRLRIEPFGIKLQKELGWQIRMVHPGNWHMTCLFFQDLDEAERALVWSEVGRNISAGAWSTLGFPWNGLALWPDARKPNLICLEAPVYEHAAGWPLADMMQVPPFTKADAAHFAQYRPHITLMRFRGVATRPYAKDWERIKIDIPQIPPSAIRFDRVSLFLSDLSPKKPIYTREYTARLG